MSTEDNISEDPEYNYQQLVQEYGSPLCILDKARVRKQYRDLMRSLPNVQLHYAIKSLPHEGVI